jgi:hypothetical protein
MAFPDRLQEGLRLKNAPNLFIMWAPNILNPHKLTANVLHPIGEVIHTSHKQRKVAMIEGVEYDVVEHSLGQRLVTIDIVALTSYQRGVFAKARQIFDRRFYLGHDKDFPQPFRLINRTFVKPGSGFDRDVHVQNVLNQIRENPSSAIQIFPYSALVQRILSFFSGNKTHYSPALAISY